ncbi:MAG: hypothetical protein IPL87_00135 [Candidatus Moraniibacteriota bacterium]|nr:MAG: hypothetical protein IPL87_00135 [Candidatus Moranbacteria bacterium]
MNISPSNSFHMEENITPRFFGRLKMILDRYEVSILSLVLSIISVIAFVFYYQNGLGLAYNDARSHLDIGRRVVEGLSPGFAQLGSVWLPLTHLLMTLTVWNDFMWHSGLAGALWSMISFVGTGVLIHLFLKELGVGRVGRLTGVFLFAANINILYLQSTAMTELVLLGTMTAAAYFLLLFYTRGILSFLILSSFFVMLATLVRYDGWFLLFFSSLMIFFSSFKEGGYRKAEGRFILFATLGGFGVFLWLLWNLLIFGDPLFFAFGPYSAHTQQQDLQSAGMLPTKGDWFLSAKMYFYALAYNTNAWVLALGFVGTILLFLDRRVSRNARFASLALFAPLFFNILALYLGHSVLFIQGLSGDTWFNIRYGIMMMPSVAIFAGFLMERMAGIRSVLVGTLALVFFFQFSSADAVTIDDGRVGSSQKNVTEVSTWLREHAGGRDGYILISAASHDSIIFSSGLPMKRFIREERGILSPRD